MVVTEVASFSGKLYAFYGLFYLVHHIAQKLDDQIYHYKFVGSCFFLLGFKYMVLYGILSLF